MTELVETGIEDSSGPEGLKRLPTLLETIASRAERARYVSMTLTEITGLLGLPKPEAGMPDDAEGIAKELRKLGSTVAELTHRQELDGDAAAQADLA